MITIEETYNRFTDETDYPLLYIAESGNYYISEDLQNPHFYLLDRTTQNLITAKDVLEYFEIFTEAKVIFYEKLFDTLFDYCQLNTGNEQDLAQIYSVIWNFLYSSQEKDSQNEYESKEVQTKVSSSLEKIEHVLYEKIVEIQENGKLIQIYTL